MLAVAVASVLGQALVSGGVVLPLEPERMSAAAVAWALAWGPASALVVSKLVLGSADQFLAQWPV